MIRHTIRTVVRYGETDQRGVVYHGNYLVYFDMGRTSLMRELGRPYGEVEKCGSFLAVTEAHCRYLAPAQFEDEIEIVTTVERVTGARVRFGYEVRKVAGGGLLAEGYTVLGCTGSDGRPRKMPEDLRKVLTTGRGGGGGTES